MKSQNNEAKIAKFYSQYPFPNIPLNKKRDIYETLLYKLISGLTKKYLDKYKGKKIKILDAGCGTGELSLGLSDGKREVLGIDNNKKSIDIAKKRIIKFKAKKIDFKHFDFVKEDLPKSYFDFIFSIGVLHHTTDPEGNFKRLLKSLKLGGYITIGIYNPYGSFKVRLKRGILKVLAGDNFEKKIEVYRKLFYRRSLTTTEKVAVADAFANPYRRYYTFEQLLMWFEKNNIEYLDSVPPIELTKNLKLIGKMIRNILLKRGKNLLDTWREVSYENSSKKWERSKIISFLTQLSWVVIGRGELINIVGRRIN